MLARPTAAEPKAVARNSEARAEAGGAMNGVIFDRPAIAGSFDGRIGDDVASAVQIPLSLTNLYTFRDIAVWARYQGTTYDCPAPTAVFERAARHSCASARDLARADPDDLHCCRIDRLCPPPARRKPVSGHFRRDTDRRRHCPRRPDVCAGHRDLRPVLPEPVR